MDLKRNQNESKETLLDKSLFVKKDFDIKELVKAIDSDQINECYFDWHMYTDADIKKLNDFFDETIKTEKKIKVFLAIEKLVEAEFLNIKKYTNKNIDFILVFDSQSYSYNEYIVINKKLDELLKDTNSKMSPYEKYKIIYNEVRHLKPYKISDGHSNDIASIVKAKQQSCNFKYLLNNEYIDCQGYSLLLATLLNKVGIEATDFGFRVFDRNGEFLGGHARTLINLDDDKYDIHGLFISDATWEKDDNNLKYSLIPISSMREICYGPCNERILYDIDDPNELDERITNLPIGRDKTSKGTALEMISKIDHLEFEKLLTLDDKSFMNELKKYVYTRSCKCHNKAI